MNTVERLRVRFFAPLRLTAVILLAVASNLLPLSAQQQTGTSRRTEQNPALMNLDAGQEDKTQTSTLVPGQIAYESTIEADRYFIGPSDLFSVNVWMSPPLNFNLPVTPEGTLILPTVGEIPVSGLSLAKAKEKVLGAMKKRYLRVEMTVTLLRPRPVLVNVMGFVLNPGVYTLTAADRVSRAIDAANTLKRTQSDEQLGIIHKGMSERHIIVRHRDGTEERVDIPKYVGTHDGQWNSFLREGDVVVVPRKPVMKSTIAVYGQVNSPGRFEFIEGEKITDAIQLAQGLTQLALPERAIFSRLGEDGTTITNTTIDLGAVLAGHGDNTLLQPGDRIVVQRKAEERADFNADVKGEVMYPGTYPITKDRTKLSEVIRMAGGFTENASLGTAYVLRQSVPPEAQEENRILGLRGEPADDDSIGFALATDLRFRHEEVSVDFPKLFGKGDSTQDVILHSDDQVIVPSKLKSIYVFGQVASPGHIPLVEGKDVNYYIQKAGGLTDHANSGSVKVIKGKTRQWLSPRDATLEDGDYVWVPTEPNHPFSYYMNIAGQAASVVSVLIGIGVIIVQVTK